MPSLRLTTGCELAYDDFYFGPPWAEPEVVVLMGGFSKHRKFWYKWIPALASRYRVLAFDLRGHNESSPVSPDFEMSLEPFVLDVPALMAELRLPAAHFVMAEFSSAVAIEVAVRFPALMRSLTIPGLNYNFKAASIDWEGWAELCDREGAGAWARMTNDLRLPADADPLMKAWYVREQSRMPGWLMAKNFRFLKNTDLTALLPQVKVPTLVMAGGGAVQEPVESVRKIKELMPHCKLVIFEKMPLNVMSACPERCIEETLQFIDGLSAKEGRSA